MTSLKEALRTGKRVTSDTTGSIKWAQKVAKEHGLDKVCVSLLKALRHAYAVGYQDGAAAKNCGANATRRNKMRSTALSYRLSTAAKSD